MNLEIGTFIPIVGIPFRRLWECFQHAHIQRHADCAPPPTSRAKSNAVTGLHVIANGTTVVIRSDEDSLRVRWSAADPQRGKRCAAVWLATTPAILLRPALFELTWVSHTYTAAAIAARRARHHSSSDGQLAPWGYVEYLPGWFVPGPRLPISPSPRYLSVLSTGRQ